MDLKNINVGPYKFKMEDFNSSVMDAEILRRTHIGPDLKKK